MMYKLEEKVFVDGVQQMHNAFAYSSLCTSQSAGIVFIDSMAIDMAPVIADINARRLEFIKINSEHGFNQAADYLIAHSELNLVHAISLDNADHLILDDNAAAFDAVHCELFKSWNGILADNTHSVNVIISGAGAVSINTPVLFACPGRSFSFASASDGCGLELVLDRAHADITITVNGMMSKGAAVRLDAANAVRRFYVDAEISVNRLNVNLIDGHAGTGNDGRNAANNFVLNNAIAGKKSADGVFIYTDNKNNIFEDITLRCANVST